MKKSSKIVITFFAAVIAATFASCSSPNGSGSDSNSNPEIEASFTPDLAPTFTSQTQETLINEASGQPVDSNVTPENVKQNDSKILYIKSTYREENDNQNRNSYTYYVLNEDGSFLMGESDENGTFLFVYEKGVYNYNGTSFTAQTTHRAVSTGNGSEKTWMKLEEYNKQNAEKYSKDEYFVEEIVSYTKDENGFVTKQAANFKNNLGIAVGNATTWSDKVCVASQRRGSESTSVTATWNDSLKLYEGIVDGKKQYVGRVVITEK